MKRERMNGKIHPFIIGKMRSWRAFLPGRWWKGRRVFVTIIDKEGFSWIWEKILQRQEKTPA